VQFKSSCALQLEILVYINKNHDEVPYLVYTLYASAAPSVGDHICLIIHLTHFIFEGNFFQFPNVVKKVTSNQKENDKGVVCLAKGGSTLQMVQLNHLPHLQYVA